MKTILFLLSLVSMNALAQTPIGEWQRSVLHCAAIHEQGITVSVSRRMDGNTQVMNHGKPMFQITVRKNGEIIEKQSLVSEQSEPVVKLWKRTEDWTETWEGYTDYFANKAYSNPNRDVEVYFLVGNWELKVDRKDENGKCLNNYCKYRIVLQCD